MKFLRTEYAALVGMGLILLATVKHAFEVYTQTMYPSNGPSMWESAYIAIMLIAIDFAVLLFTIHDNRYAAQTFASLIFLLNLFAFWQHTTWGGWNASLLLYIPGFLFSGMFAYGLYYFTDVFSEFLRSHKEQGDLQEKVAPQEKTISLLTEEKEKLASQLKEVDHQAVENLRQQAASLSLVMDYLLQEGGYLNKSKEALRKGVEYWTKKSQEEALDSQGWVKLLTYTEALTRKLVVPA